MQKIKSVKFNFLMNLILTGSAILFPLLTFPYVSRILGPEGIGKVAFGTSFISYFVMLSCFGVGSYGVRAIAQVREDIEKLSKTTQEILFINLIMMSFSYLLFFGGIFISDTLEKEKILFSVISFQILFTILAIEWFYAGIEQFQYVTIRTLLFRLMALVSTFVFINTKDDYIVFALIGMIATVGASILNLINIRKYISFKYYSNYELKKHLKPMFLLFLTGFAIAIYTNINTTMLGFLRTDMDVGYYNTAVRIKAISLSVVTSLGVVLLPRLSYYIQHNMQAEFHTVLKKSVNFVMLVALPAVIFCVLFAKEMILVLAGHAYMEAILPLQIIIFTVLLAGLTNVLGNQILLSLKKEGKLLISVVLAAIVSVVLNIMLIPKFGATGAAISTTIAELLVLIIQCVFLKNYLKVLFGNIQYIKIITALIISACFTKWLLSEVNYSEFLVLALSALVFFILYLALLLLTKEKFLFENIFMPIKHKVRY